MPPHKMQDAPPSAVGADALDLKLLQRSLTADEADFKVYENNVHDTMREFPELRKQRMADFYRVFKLICESDNARDKRRKVFDFFNKEISAENNFQTSEIYTISHELLVLVDEFRELLDRLYAWCNLCMPANDQAFAESHRQKIKNFQAQLVQEMKRSNSTRTQVSSTHSMRLVTLRNMFSTKDVAGKNVEAWEKAHHDLLTLQESNSYLLMARNWENILESMLLLYNYWKINLSNERILFLDGKTAGNSDYFA